MFEGAEVGMVVWIDTISFPIVGKLTEITDVRICIENGVRVLWDGRHHEFAKGKPPSNAELEETITPLYVSIDDVRQWGPYPKMLKTQ